ncbi:MAG TPA: MBL fold metallo-hydrolase [Longimicrobiales bacterium]
MQLAFLGAAGTVTGSRYLVTTPERIVLVDCGLFQGLKQLRLRNRARFPVEPRRIDAVILTHAHLDHTGYLPVLVRDGFEGPIYCTAATADLCRMLLPDSGRIQEEDAAYANRKGFSRHRPALPLYTAADAERALERLTPVAGDAAHDLGAGLAFRFLAAGHILGASMVELRGPDTGILFSGDLGRPQDPILPPPTAVAEADHLVLESTYGDRLHDRGDPAAVLGEVIARTAERGGVVVIPAFAVGRTQTVLYHVNRLRAARSIPDIPVFLDSPMAANATRLLHAHVGEHRLTPPQCVAVCSTAKIVNSVEESKELSRRREPAVIISASGMATGGRVLHHLKAFAPDPRNTILLTGYQAAGTRGASIAAGAGAVKIHGEYVPIRAEVAAIHGLSAHADRDEILDWLAGFRTPPRRTFITHGEPVPADALRHAIEERFGWDVTVPEHLERVTLAGSGVPAGD